MATGEVGAHILVAANLAATEVPGRELDCVTIHSHREVESPVSVLVLKWSIVKLQVVYKVNFKIVLIKNI
jgi:hypothetical protein